METFVLEFAQLLEKLQTALRRLTTLIEQSSLVDARVYQLPPVLKEDTHKPLPKIVPVQIDGPEALDLALKAYRDFYASPGLSTKAVMRMPGVIVIHPKRMSILIDQVAEVNRIKDDPPKPSSLTCSKIA